jgi:far upstream element-binding protein
MFGTGPSMYGEPSRGGGAPPPPPPHATAAPGPYGAPPGPYGAPPGPYGGGQGAPYGAPPGPPMRAPPPGPIGGDPAAVTEYVMCPPEKAGKVIGHGGDKINGIQAESGASVKIQNQSDVGPGQPRRITITGSPDRVARASQLVYALIQDGAAARAPTRGGGGGGSGGSEIFVPVDPEHFGKIIGRGGDTIRRLQEESGVRMQVDRANSRVQITGDASGCEVARTLLREVLDASPDAAATSGQTTTEIPAQGQEGRIIGKGGENIRALSAQTGAKITIIKETGMVRVSGDADRVRDAVAAVEDFIEQQINPVRVTNAGVPVDERAVESYGGGGGGDGGGGLTPYKPLWETHQSPEGYTYYYNTTTGETQWEEPEDYDGYS